MIIIYGYRSNCAELWIYEWTIEYLIAQKHLRFWSHYSNIIASISEFFFWNFLYAIACVWFFFSVHQGLKNMHKDFLLFIWIKFQMKWVFQNANHGSIQYVCQIVNKNLHFFREFHTENTKSCTNNNGTCFYLLTTPINAKLADH